jgi:hypothetical protein
VAYVDKQMDCVAAVAGSNLGCIVSLGKNNKKRKSLWCVWCGGLPNIAEACCNPDLGWVAFKVVCRM